MAEPWWKSYEGIRQKAEESAELIIKEARKKAGIYECQECGKTKRSMYNPVGNYIICKDCLEEKRL